MNTGRPLSGLIVTTSMLLSLIMNISVLANAEAMTPGVGASVRLPARQPYQDIGSLKNSTTREAKLQVHNSLQVQALATATQLTSLSLNYPGNGIDLSPLRALQRLEKLSLVITGTPEQYLLKFLSSLPALQHLSLYWSDDSARKGIVHLPLLPQISELRIAGGNDCTYSIGNGAEWVKLQALNIDAALSNQNCIAAMPALKRLTTGNSFTVNTRGRAALARLSKFEQFNGKLTSEVPISSWTALKHLQAVDVKAEMLKKIAKLSALETLSISIDRFSDSELKQLGSLTRLTSLALKTKPAFDGNGRIKATRNCSGDGLASLTNAKALVRLSIDGLPLSDKLIGAVSKLPHLRSLTIADDGSDLTLAQARMLNKLVSVEELQLPWPRTNMITALRQCGDLRKLKALDLTNQKLKDSDLAILQSFPQLVTLNLTDNLLTDRCIDSLLHLRRLKELHLGGNPIRGTKLAKLLTLPLTLLHLNNTHLADEELAQLTDTKAGLTALDRSQNNISGSTLSTLSRLPELTYLSLASTRITDSALSKLRSAKLEELNIEDTEITEHGVQALTRLPSLKNVVAFDAAIKANAKLPPSLAVSYQTDWQDSSDSERAHTSTTQAKPVVLTPDANATAATPGHKQRSIMYTAMGQHSDNAGQHSKAEAEYSRTATEYSKTAAEYTAEIDALMHPDTYICSSMEAEHKRRLFHAYDGRAMARADNGKYAEALEDLNNANRIARASAEGRAHRAYIYAKLGRKEDAQAELARALDINPDSREALAGQAILLYPTANSATSSVTSQRTFRRAGHNYRYTP